MQEYDILLKTPMGDKEGRLSVTALQGRPERQLEVLRDATPFSGEIDESGFCRISGQLIDSVPRDGLHPGAAAGPGHPASSAADPDHRHRPVTGPRPIQERKRMK